MPPPPAVDVPAEYAALTEAYAFLEQCLALPDAALFAVVPAVSQWSVAHQAYHTALSTSRMMRVIEALHVGGLATTEDGEANAIGQWVLEHGTMVRGRGQAPEHVRPPEAVTREDLAETLTRGRRKLAQIADVLPVLEGLTRRLAHPVFGQLNAVQWLRVARIHADHHRAIIRDIQAHQAAAL
jgi:hypothetical protein